MSYFISISSHKNVFELKQIEAHKNVLQLKQIEGLVHKLHQIFLDLVICIMLLISPKEKYLAPHLKESLLLTDKSHAGK